MPLGGRIRGDHAAGLLRVHAVHEDEPFTSALTKAVDREIRDLANWLNLGVGPARPSIDSQS